MYRKLIFILAALLIFIPVMNGQSTGGSDDTAQTSPEKPKRAPAFRPTKDQVLQGQTMLKNKGLFDGEATGIYSPETRTSIKAFQKANGLDVNGKFDRMTLEKMNIELTDKQKEMPASAAATKSPKPESKATSSGSTKTTKTAEMSKNLESDDKPKRMAPFRANKDQIMAAQKLLKTNSMYSGEETGKLDDATREGLKMFQEKNNVKVTGTLNAVTLEAMGIELTDKQKADSAAAAAMKKE